MSLEQQRGPRVDTSQRECAGCQQAVAGPRCDWCGAALAPGGFTVERVMAQGPRGRVYQARDEQGRRVALKELLFAAVPDASEVDAFEREAATLRTLSHPAIPRFISSFSEGGGVHLRLYLAFELVEGEPLSARLARGPLGEEELYTVARQALEVLAYLHGHEPPVLHRDIKPENLLVRADGRLAVVDFGSARWLTSGARTFGSTLVGTFGYMPPEQLGGTVDATSDLYALGATLLHAATAQPPAQLLGEGLRLRIPAQVPATLRAVLGQMLELRPELRLPSARAVREALEASRDPERAAAESRLWRTQLVAAVGLGLSVTMAAAVFLVSESSAPAPRAQARARGPEEPRTWFARAQPHCSPAEVSPWLAQVPPIPGWEGTGYAAGCLALAGEVESARALLLRLPESERWQAAGILFEVGHGLAERGEGVAVAPLMNLVLELWPEHPKALYHAAMADLALGRVERARQRLERFLELYSEQDTYQQRAREARARAALGRP